MAKELTFKPIVFNHILPSLLDYVKELPDAEYILTIKKKNKKRSRNANSYLWEMCTQLADAVNSTKEDIYRDAIKSVGIYKDFQGLSQKDGATLMHAWGMLGTGWISEQVDFMPDGDNVIIRCYYGSSTYNTKQMSRLIDYVVQDCKAVGIDTMTEQERSLLLEEWGNEQN